MENEIRRAVQATSTVIIPPFKSASPEELDRRKALRKQAALLRELMPPLGMTTSELIRQVRDDAETSESELAVDGRAS